MKASRSRVWCCVALLSVSLMAVTGCGDDAERVLPIATITPTPVTPIAGEGPFLQPLTEGSEIQAPDARYTLRVPLGWRAINAPPSELAYALSGTSDASNAVTINITRQNVGADLTVLAYAESARAANQDIFKDVITLSFGPVQIGAYGSYRWVYTATTGGAPRFIYQVFIIDGQQAFVLTAVAPADIGPSLQALFDSIAGSWSFVRG